MEDMECNLVQFCNGIKNGMTHYTDQGFFDELMETIASCTGNDIVFRVMEHVTDMGNHDFDRSEDAIAYLFDQVELFNKEVKGVELNEGHYRLNDKYITTYYIYIWLGERGSTKGSDVV